jgi:hypothetical protein
MKSKNHLFTPSMQMFLGLIWQTYIMEDTKHLTLGAGYEVNYYWRMNQMLEMDETRNSTLNQVTLVTDGYENNSEDVMFYGITFKIKLEF